MLRTYLYITDELEKRINQAVQFRKKSKAEILREAIKKGLQESDNENNAGVEALLKLARLAKKYKVKGPRDASINHDYYLWGLPKKAEIKL